MAKLSKTGILSIIAAMTALGAPYLGIKTKAPKANNKMPLSKDEEAILGSLSGKEKKLYVKNLKEKYKK